MSTEQDERAWQRHVDSAEGNLRTRNDWVCRELFFAGRASAKAEQGPRPWDEGGRDDYYSKLPGDARLVAGLPPLAEHAPGQPSAEELIARIKQELDPNGYNDLSAGAQIVLSELARRLGVKP